MVRLAVLAGTMLNPEDTSSFLFFAIPPRAADIADSGSEI